MNIALVDDDRELLEKLRVLMIQQFAEVSDRLYNIDTFESAEEFFADWSAGKYGLIVLDIYMGDANGITAAERIRETDSDVRIAFCTSSNEFATETYGVNASDYLQKPITAEKVARLLQKANFEEIEKGEETVITNIRHKNQISMAIKNVINAIKTIDENMPIDIIAIYIKQILEDLSKITGDNVSEDIINEIFSKFCLGK